ncbi:hypothetical protein BGW36DRAFT_172693 [Talaromyces proteolyticus]|uniref:Uncharacterized protein n=1 Tax=Talaromyces proteolyticus TaxID=1131652 RepID=A0AAD4KSB9_9EURO|nr:uncharacterized protein BGW36DRAFT_172693 [Talaromyces proteolyticus]KAH8697693.1 hypothetical protein BGW36DRAFT_172693 [Talaromyces proteolyticus]
MVGSATICVFVSCLLAANFLILENLKTFHLHFASFLLSTCLCRWSPSLYKTYHVIIHNSLICFFFCNQSG